MWKAWTSFEGVQEKFYQTTRNIGRKKTSSANQDRGKKDFKELECFNYHQKGHYASNCPQRAQFCMERRMDHKGQSITKRRQAQDYSGNAKPGMVEGEPVKSILLDTGCSRTLVRNNLVPKHKLLHGEVVAIRCAPGDTVLYPLAEVELEVEGYPLRIEAAVSDTLPMSVPLGTDLPELTAILTGNLKMKSHSSQQSDDALVATTRAMAKKQEGESVIQTQKEKESGAEPTLLVETQSDNESNVPDDTSTSEPSRDDDRIHWKN